MIAVLVVVLVLAGAMGLGGLLLMGLAARCDSWNGTIVEAILLSGVLGVLVLGWMALILAEIGYFSPVTLVVLWLACILGLAFWLRRQVVWPTFSFTPMPRWEWLALGIWLIAAGYLFFRPHQCIIGGADSGVYVNLGANIARSGGILIHDQTLAELDPILYPALLREYPDGQPTPYYLFPGFYVPGEPAGFVVPQFYPLHPVWLAVLFSFGGLEANLLGTPLWALLGSLAVYLAAREMFGWKAAVLSLCALSINAMQVWFARYPTAEMLTQYVFWMGVYAFAAWFSGRQPARVWALVAGLGLGAVLLVRIDVYFLLAVPLLLVVWLRWNKQRPASSLWFFIPMLGLSIHSLVHGLFFSWPYFNDTFQHGILLLGKYLMPLALLALLGLAGLVSLGRRADWREQVVDKWLAGRPIVLGLLIVVVLALAVYGYWIRPVLGGSLETRSYWYGGGEIPMNLDRENLIRLGWYLSPLGIALAVWGACLLLWKLDRKTILFMGCGLFFSLLYLWRIQANPHQIYVMRRYVPVVMPFFVVAAAYGVVWVYERPARWQKVLGIVVGAVWVLSLAWLARGFVSQVDYRGVVAQMDELNSRLAPNSVLIFNDQSPVGQGDFLGTSLQFLYGHTVYSLRQPELLPNGHLERQIEKWQSEHRQVYWLGQPPVITGDDALEYLGDYQTSLVVLEAAFEARPWQRITIGWGGSINRVKE